MGISVDEFHGGMDDFKVEPAVRAEFDVGLACGGGNRRAFPAAPPSRCGLSLPLSGYTLPIRVDALGMNFLLVLEQIGPCEELPPAPALRGTAQITSKRPAIGRRDCLSAMDHGHVFRQGTPGEGFPCLGTVKAADFTFDWHLLNRMKVLRTETTHLVLKTGDRHDPHFRPRRKKQ